MPDSEYMDPLEDQRFVELRADFEKAFPSLVAKFEFLGLDRDGAIDQVVGRFEKLHKSVWAPLLTTVIFHRR